MLDHEDNEENDDGHDKHQAGLAETRTILSFVGLGGGTGTDRRC